MAKDIQPRGFRNNNPLNIRKGSKWKGLSPVQGDKSFCVFTSMRYGIRAGMYLLLRYYNQYQLCTIYDIISRWAPHNENDTLSYCRQVAKQLGIAEKHIAVFDLELNNWSNLYELISAMIYVENGKHLFINASEFLDILKNEIPSSLK